MWVNNWKKTNKQKNKQHLQFHSESRFFPPLWSSPLKPVTTTSTCSKQRTQTERCTFTVYQTWEISWTHVSLTETLFMSSSISLTSRVSWSSCYISKEKIEKLNKVGLIICLTVDAQTKHFNFWMMLMIINFFLTNYTIECSDKHLHVNVHIICLHAMDGSTIPLACVSLLVRGNLSATHVVLLGYPNSYIKQKNFNAIYITWSQRGTLFSVRWF